jgi:hypothetical protein
MVKSYIPTEGDTMITDNYDLNIWDKAGYFSEGEQEGWSIAVYTINKVGDSYGSGKMIAEFDLQPDEARALTLGVSTDLGGDYTPDEDFWLDRQTFYETYTTIPARVREFLEGVGT